MASTGLTCVECRLCCAEEEMQWHIQESNHFAVIHPAVDSEIQCELCDQRQISRLRLIQNGTKDMLLCCVSCLDSSIPRWREYIATDPSAGEFFSDLSTYYKVSQLRCACCSSKERVLLRKDGRVALCHACFEGSGLPRGEYLERGMDDGVLILCEDDKKAKIRIAKKALRLHSVTQEDIPDTFEPAWALLEHEHSAVAYAIHTPERQGGQDPGAPTKYIQGTALLPSLLSNDDTTNNELVPYNNPYHWPHKSTRDNNSPDPMLSDEEILNSQWQPNNTPPPPTTTEKPLRLSDFIPMSKSQMTQLRNSRQASHEELHPHTHSLPVLEHSTPQEYARLYPKLTYDTITEYYKELSDHIALEQASKQRYTPHCVAYDAYTPKMVRMTVGIPAQGQFGGGGGYGVPFAFGQCVFLQRCSEPGAVVHCRVVDCVLVCGVDERSVTCEVLVECLWWNERSFTGFVDVYFQVGEPWHARMIDAMLRLRNPMVERLVRGVESEEGWMQWKCGVQHTRLDVVGLSPDQKMVIDHAMNHPVTMVHAPPGTGKTAVICEMVGQLKSMDRGPIVIVAATEHALDEICGQILDLQHWVLLRIISEMKEREYAEGHCLETICLHHQMLGLLPVHVKSIHDRRQAGEEVSHAEMSEYESVCFMAKVTIVRSAQVILTTCLTAGSPLLDGLFGDITLIVTDSSHLSEAEILIPLSLRNITKVVLFGDAQQLGPSSIVPYLQKSLFERIQKNGTTPILRLVTQYRSHPGIIHFPNRHFYKHKLRSGVPNAHHRQIMIRSGLLVPTLFVDTGPSRTHLSRPLRLPSGLVVKGYTNEHEADRVVALVHKLVEVHGIPMEEVVLLAAYSVQRDLLCELVQKDDVLNAGGDPVVVSVDGDVVIKSVAGLRVATVDSFQGHEAGVVVVSCVVSGDEKMDVWEDERRANVALMSAKSSCIVVGDGDKLKTWGVWRSYICELEVMSRVVRLR